MNKDEMIRTQAELLKSYIEYVSELQDKIVFLESYNSSIKHINDKDYPFSRALDEEIDD